jgi:gliding motility-associated-like protein
MKLTADMNQNYAKIMLSLGLITSLTSLHAQSPGNVPTDNTVWLKADVGTTLNPTNNVTTWAEQSGAAITGDFSTHNPGASGTTQQAPLFVTTGFNFNPYLQFVSTNPNCISSNNLIAGTSILGSQEMTMYQVINLKTTTGTGVWCKWQTSNTNTYRLGDEVNNGSNPGQIRLDFRGGSLYSSVSVANTQVIYGASAAATTRAIRLNGAANATGTPTQTFAPSGTARLSLGNENEAGADAYPTTIDIAEFILFKRNLTAAEKNKVESYLAVKYGFTLAQTAPDANNYTNSGGAVIWNNAGNTGYLNNITGIGRDDSTGLNQKQSLSITNRAMVTMYHGNTGGTFPATNAANTTTFGADRSYVLFGDNLADTLVTHCSTDGSFVKMARTWKVQVSGTPGDVTLSLEKANVPPTISALLVANDPNFTSGLQIIPIQDNGTELYADYTFANNQYFTFGTVPLTLNGVVTPVVCQGGNGAVVLSPTGGAAPFTYSWNTTPPQTTQNITNVDQGNYTVTVNQGNGCIYTENYTVTGTANPVFIKIRDTSNTICTSDNGMITVAGLGGTPSYSFSIDGGPLGSQLRFNNLAKGVHNIHIKDQNGCVSDTSITLSNYSYTLKVADSAQDAWCDAAGLGGAITVIANGGSEPYGYFWDNLPLGKGPVENNLPKGTYKIIVTDVYGCFGTVVATLDENSCCQVGMPNAFTPNNDGQNDKFQAVTNRAIPRFEMTVFNRWGQKVFYTTKYDDGWNGTYQNTGKVADLGVYYYKVKYTCERGNKEITRSGDLTLIR